MTSQLRSSLIRLAHTKPELRPHLLPLLAAQSRYPRVEREIRQDFALGTITPDERSELLRAIEGAPSESAARDLVSKHRRGRYAKVLSAPDKAAEAKYKEFFAGGKMLFAACNKMEALAKRHERMTGYGSRNTTSPADLVKLYTEINTLQASVKRLVDALVDGYPSWHKDAVTERSRDAARTVLSQNKQIDVNTTYAGMQVRDVLHSFRIYYYYLENVVHDLSGMLGAPELPPNPLHKFD